MNIANRINDFTGGNRCGHGLKRRLLQEPSSRRKFALEN
jgi:hypothetical protein